MFPKKEKQDAFTTFEEYEDQEDEGVSLKEMQMRSATETEAEEKAQGVFSNHVGQKRHTKQSKDKNHKKVTQNVSNTKDKGKKLLDFLGDVAYRRAISYIGKELIYLLKKWMPRRFMADFGFAMPSPDQTGYVLGAISCIPLRNAQIKRLDPDFLSEDPYFEGELQCQGKIQLYVVVFALLRLVMKKECRKLFHYLGGE